MKNDVIAYEGLLNVSLGVLQEAHLEQFIIWANRIENVEGTMQRPPHYLANSVDWLRGLAERKGRDEVFAIFTRDGNGGEPRYIGHTGIHSIQWPEGFGTTGSVIGDRTTQGKGHGTEAKLLLQYHAFMVLGLRKLTSDVKAFNAQSLGHLLKCGYRIVGRQKKHLFHKGQFVDKILLEVFREGWEIVWRKYQKEKKLPRLSTKQRAIVQKETAR